VGRFGVGIGRCDSEMRRSDAVEAGISMSEEVPRFDAWERLRGAVNGVAGEAGGSSALAPSSKFAF
jgi:hypothetical protein